MRAAGGDDSCGRTGRELRGLGWLLAWSLCVAFPFASAWAAQSGRATEAPRPLSKQQIVALRKSLDPHFEVPGDFASTAAYRYGQLSRERCEAELKKRGIAFRRESARGVAAPVRLLGPLRGVSFYGEGTKETRAQSPHEIADCRLVLALDDCAVILSRYGIVEVRHYSMYRLPPPSWPRSRPATRHLGAVAIDAGQFIKKDGSVLDVDRHFHGAIGAKTCGPGAAPRPATPEARELRALLCEIVAAHLFNVVLTPNYNQPHKNHFHLEVTAGKEWFLVH